MAALDTKPFLCDVADGPDKTVRKSTAIQLLGPVSVPFGGTALTRSLVRRTRALFVPALTRRGMARTATEVSMLLGNDADICAQVSLSPHECSALAEACSAYADEIHEKGSDERNERKGCYLALATARGIYTAPASEPKIRSIMEVQ